MRQASHDDLLAAARMKALAWRQAYADAFPEVVFERQDAGVERTAAMWRADLDRGGYYWLVVDAGGAIVGVAHAAVSLESDAPVPLELGMIYLLDQAKGSGVADRLLQTTVGDAECYLWVLDDNPRAQAFYQRHGFVADGVSRELPPHYGQHRELRMVRRADPDWLDDQPGD